MRAKEPANEAQCTKNASPPHRSYRGDVPGPILLLGSRLFGLEMVGPGGLVRSGGESTDQRTVVGSARLGRGLLGHLGLPLSEPLRLGHSGGRGLGRLKGWDLRQGRGFVRGDFWQIEVHVAWFLRLRAAAAARPAAGLVTCRLRRRAARASATRLVARRL